MAHQHDHDEHGDGESFGMALGFRIFEDDGQLFLAEVEITPHVDEPTPPGAAPGFPPPHPRSPPGARLVEDAGQPFPAEVEITPYVDEPTALGATLVFHPLNGIDPTSPDQEGDAEARPADVDDDLPRAPRA